MALADLPGTPVHGLGWDGAGWVITPVRVVEGPVTALYWFRTGHYTDLIAHPDTRMYMRPGAWRSPAALSHPPHSLKYTNDHTTKIGHPVGLPAPGTARYTPEELHALAAGSVIRDPVHQVRTMIPRVVTTQPRPAVLVYVRGLLHRLAAVRGYTAATASWKFAGCRTADKYRLIHLLHVAGLEVTGPQPSGKADLFSLDTSTVAVEEPASVARIRALLAGEPPPEAPAAWYWPPVRVRRPVWPRPTVRVTADCGNLLVRSVLCQT